MLTCFMCRMYQDISNVQSHIFQYCSSWYNISCLWMWNDMCHRYTIICMYEICMKLLHLLFVAPFLCSEYFTHSHNQWNVFNNKDMFWFYVWWYDAFWFSYDSSEDSNMTTQQRLVNNRRCTMTATYDIRVSKRTIKHKRAVRISNVLSHYIP